MRTWHSMDIFIHILGPAKQDLNSTWLSATGRAVPEDKTIWRVASNCSTFSKSSNLILKKRRQGGQLLTLQSVRNDVNTHRLFL